VKLLQDGEVPEGAVVLIMELLAKDQFHMALVHVLAKNERFWIDKGFSLDLASFISCACTFDAQRKVMIDRISLIMRCTRFDFRAVSLAAQGNRGFCARGKDNFGQGLFLSC
jgi:hypothetical protein